MDQLHIAELNPELTAIESKHFRATVTLLWPYSSSARQFALLLAEPDVRLRRKNGQVRARFSGSSAKAIATTGVGIGDEVVLSLRGADFVKEGTVNTPGKSLEWDLSYTQTVVVQIYRKGSEIANLEHIDVAPTPASPPPVRRESAHVSSPAQQYSSPAFLKRARLSDGPFFQAPYDPFADDNEDGHDKKRRRKSYRDWKAWTYSARTPSPEKEDVTMGEEEESLDASPSRAAQLPRTPVSPSKPELLSVAAGPVEAQEDDHEKSRVETENTVTAVENQDAEQNMAHSGPAAKQDQGDTIRDTQHYEPYADPDEFPTSDAQYAFGGDTEVDTEANTEEEGTIQDEPEVISASSTEADTEGAEEAGNGQLQRTEEEVGEPDSVSSEEEAARKDTDRRPAIDSFGEVLEGQQAAGFVSVPGDHVLTDGNVAITSLPLNSSGVPMIAMPPPPTLSALETEFTSAASGLLKEPASPTLQPQDSANLPLPSPFPGERESNATSYLDLFTTRQQRIQREAEVEEQQQLPSEASYIGETSFFSSIGSSRASGFHPNHESAFTPVRFTFGMDGAGWSRPMQLSSSPAPEALLDKEQEIEHDNSTTVAPMETTASATVDENSNTASEQIVNEATKDDHAAETLATARDGLDGQEVIALSSDSEPDEEDEDKAESEDLTRDEQSIDSNHAEHPEQDIDTINGFQAATTVIEDNGDTRDVDEAATKSPRLPAATPAVIDLGSPSDDNSEVEDAEMEDAEQQPRSSTRNTPIPDQHQEVALQDQSPSKDHDNQSEFVNPDFAIEGLKPTVLSKEQTLTHTQPQEPETMIDTPSTTQPLPVHDHTQQPVGPLEDYLQDTFPMEALLRGWERADVPEQHPDIKMESVEENSPFHISQSKERVAPRDPAEIHTKSPNELSIIVPEEGGHVLGELHTVTVPDTSPTRNTRSKTKTLTSPIKEEPTSKRTTRSTRSKTSVTSIARSAISPPPMRIRSTASPSQNAAQVSPYSLRSQSKLLSPTKSTSATTNAVARRSPRKHLSQRSVDSFSGVESSQLTDRDPFLTSFEPSEELGASQGRYSDVTLIKDSEEESVRSENSLSTVYSDDLAAQYANHSDPGERATSPDESQTEVKPPRSTAPEPRTKRSAKTAWKKTGPQVVTELEITSPARSNFSLSTQPLAGSPSRRLRSTAPIEAASPSSRMSDLSPEPEETAEEQGDVTPKATLSGEGQSTQRNAIDVDEFLRSSPPTEPAITQHSSMNNNKPISPSATQKPTLEPTTRSASPTLVEPSSDSDPPTTLAPSIGLSTPLAYYTPLQDLPYFLNRSSQFHSASNPDILALVTSASTTPSRATKGPRHWNTTFHITDASTYPASTTVQVFRAYNSALPVAEVGDIILLGAFAVKSLNRQPMLVSADESSWCVWRWGKPVWGAKRGAFGELRAREEVKGPVVERGEGEWREVERLRTWFVGTVRGGLEDMEDAKAKTRSRGKDGE